MIFNYVLGYLAFSLGSTIYLITKIQEYRKTAKANPNPNFVFSMKDFWSDEWLNVLKLQLGGIALVLFLPILIGGTTVDIKNTAGAVVTSFALKVALMPMYFVLGYSGNSAVFALFGKYKKTFVNQMGIDD
jgi:hypothetical protein